jgi:hypothetical protein
MTFKHLEAFLRSGYWPMGNSFAYRGEVRFCLFVDLVRLTVGRWYATSWQQSRDNQYRGKAGVRER